MNATNPAKQRRFTKAKNASPTYHWLTYVEPYVVKQLDDSELLPVLTFRGRQLGRLMARSKQMAQRVAEIKM